MFQEEPRSRWGWNKVKGEKQEEERSDGNREPDHVGFAGHCEDSEIYSE